LAETPCRPPVLVPASLQVTFVLFCSCINTCGAGGPAEQGYRRSGRGPLTTESLLPGSDCPCGPQHCGAMPGSSCLQRCATLLSLLSTQWERLAPLQLLSIVWRGGAVLRDFFFLMVQVCSQLFHFFFFCYQLLNSSCTSCVLSFHMQRLFFCSSSQMHF